jgi:dGTP triphosphohydrolase
VVEQRAWTDDVVRKIEATLAKVTACPLFDHDWQHLAEHCEDPVGMIVGTSKLEAQILQIDDETSFCLHTAADIADRHECDIATLKKQIIGNISATVITADQVQELIKTTQSQGAIIASLLGNSTLQEARIKELEKNVRDLATGLQQFHGQQDNINQRHAVKLGLASPPAYVPAPSTAAGEPAL